MKEPLEHRLSQMPLSRAPAHWRHAILEKAQAVPEGSPQTSGSRISANWIALAAAWTLSALLQWDSNRGTPPETNELPESLSIPILSVLRSPEVYLEALLADPPSLPPAPKQSSHATHKADIIA